MDISIRTDEDTTMLRIAGAMTIYEAAAGKVALLRAFAESKAGMAVDLSAVTEIDTAGLQLLAMSKREAGRAGRAWQVVRHSAATREAARLLNLGETL